LASGVVVIDVDPRHGGNDTLDELQATWGRLPPTLEGLTGGGGRHLWYRSPPLQLPSGELGPGVELKAQGGLVVVPPSRHVAGTDYEWVEGSREVVELPAWVSGLAQGRPPVGRRDREAPVRTESERSEFAGAWARAGISVTPGDAYYLCPFHDDHHPSLHIDADGCRWYCFGCHAGGGIGRLRQRLGDAAVTVPRSRLSGFVGTPRQITMPGDDPVEVVGESFHQDELLRLAGGLRHYGGVELQAVAELVPVEKQGVEVRIESVTVGYLREDDRDRAAAVRVTIDRHGLATCRAAIRGGWDRGGDDVGLFGVTLYLPSS
jgi:hypothetical protein